MLNMTSIGVGMERRQCCKGSNGRAGRGGLGPLDTQMCGVQRGLLMSRCPSSCPSMGWKSESADVVENSLDSGPPAVSWVRRDVKVSASAPCSPETPFNGTGEPSPHSPPLQARV